MCLQTHVPCIVSQVLSRIFPICCFLIIVLMSSTIGRSATVEKILFEARDEYYQSQIYCINIDGSDMRRLTDAHGIGASYPSVDKSGQRIVYIVTDKPQRSHLYIMDTDGSKSVCIYPAKLEETVEISRPSFTEDGKEILFSLKDGACQVLACVNIQSKALRKLPSSSKQQASPSIVPNENAIIYDEKKDGLAPKVIRMENNGASVKALIDRGENAVYSPDCSLIAFQRTDRYTNIFACLSDGTNVKQLTDNGNCNYSPAFSPDGSKIAFAAYSVREKPDAKRMICTINADGTGYTEFVLKLKGRPTNIKWARLMIEPKHIPPSPPWKLFWDKVITPPQPDLIIKFQSSGDSVGDGVYDVVGNQEIGTEVPWGRIAVYFITVRNVGGMPEKFSVNCGSQPISARWTVHFYDMNGRDITRRFAGTGISTPELAPGESISYRLEVTAASSVVNGDIQEVSVKAVSPIDATIGDAVKTTTTKVAAN